MPPLAVVRLGMAHEIIQYRVSCINLSLLVEFILRCLGPRRGRVAP